MKGPRSFKAKYTSLKVTASMKLRFLPCGISIQLISSDFDVLNAKVNSFFVCQRYLRKFQKLHEARNSKRVMLFFEAMNEAINRFLLSNICESIVALSSQNRDWISACHRSQRFMFESKLRLG